ncbi:hypothetical protein Poli38472_008808 [Pythium oligandrum]|uniref:Uncharacterized protein n=1 Tax=Pythium oligandrum TaxID=41045 RepID=A0A8K1FAE1_PYTOL|nr:hypothetical protein Poli38472_008808 [Pythium oligandrum]|eukprot:TMW56160.1 hypothetical protein Poli38472_008808 [Pythium oligandrum]
MGRYGGGGFVWHMGAHLTGSIILGLSYVKPEKFVSYVRWGLFVYFLIASLDVALTRYHVWKCNPLTPQPKRFALVTGATNGIGREIAYALAEKKYSVIIVARTEPILHRMRAEMELVNKPIEVEYCACDLATSKGVQTLFDFLKEKNFVIDVLVNAAAAVEQKDFKDLPAEKVDELLHLNLMAMTKITHFIVPDMVKRGTGRILNISSLGAVASTPTAAIFGASKAYIASFSQAINYELRSTGVTATCYHAGAMEVDLNDPAVSKKALTTVELSYTTVVHPKDSAKYALDALFDVKDVAYDSYLNHLWAFLLRGLIPTRVGQALVAIAWHKPQDAVKLLKR